MSELALIGGIVLVLVAAIVAAVVMRRRRSDSGVLVDEVVDADEMAELLPAVAPSPLLAEPAPEPTRPLPVGSGAAELDARKRDATNLATADPAHTADVLRALMEQEVQL
jgi:flagellar biosynthesis/type III secretory pathway M-ring protein FliF/YscJ